MIWKDPRRWIRQLPASVIVATGAVALVAATVAVALTVDRHAFWATADRAVHDPTGITLAVSAFAAAFAVRAVAWQAMVPGLPFGQAFAAINASAGANHVLPLRLGEGLRVVSVVRRTKVSLPVATASAITLRTADMLTCATVALVGGPHLISSVLGPWGGAALVVVAGAGAVAVGWVARLRRSNPIRLPGPFVLTASLAAWALEAVLVLVAARWAGINAGFSDALVVVGTSVAAQVAAVAPGGFGTYEAAAVAAWTALGHDPAAGLVAALTAHALKTAYTLVAGGVSVIIPAPGLAGRFRLAPVRHRASGPVGDGPVILVLPARNEAPRVGGVIARVPKTVDGRPVHCIVVDDGSGDDTAAVARAAGATVVTVEDHHGLGAAVRRGLAEGVAQGGAVVAFCDADGEYAPEDLAPVVSPILRGDAEYVVGSRFAGDIERMLLHRRAGNVMLTKVLAFIARRPITDGQSGFRALSADAAAAAEITHDFNYAQVLTLDLLQKGFRYAEVPISYGFRTSGRSFVRLPTYLRAVIPAVYRQVNRDETLSVLHDVSGERTDALLPAARVVDGVDGQPGFEEGVVGVVVGEQPEAAEAP